MVSKNLINLYFNFAKHSKVVYGDHIVEAVDPDDMEALAITKAGGLIFDLDEDFGNVEFWDDIEDDLSGAASLYSMEFSRHFMSLVLVIAAIRLRK